MKEVQYFSKSMLNMLLISFAIFALAGLYPAASTDLPGPSFRITNGVPVSSINRYPYIGAVRKNNKFVCAAAIVKPNLVITTGQCAKDLKNGLLTFTAGILERRTTPSRDLQVRRIRKVVPHPKYQSRAYHDYDIALVFLARPLQLTNSVNIVKLADKDYIGETGTLAGWGRDENYKEVQRLVSGSAVVQSENDCKKAFEPREQITDTTGCAKSSNDQVICRDSGVPFVFQQNDNPLEDVLIGLGSHTEINNGRCDISKPSIFSKAVALRDWILAADDNN